MKYMTRIALALLLSALFGLGGSVALAHGGKGSTLGQNSPQGQTNGKKGLTRSSFLFSALKVLGYVNKSMMLSA
jgi:hypothetical protein